MLRANDSWSVTAERNAPRSQRRHIRLTEIVSAATLMVFLMCLLTQTRAQRCGVPTSKLRTPLGCCYTSQRLAFMPALRIQPIACFGRGLNIMVGCLFSWLPVTDCTRPTIVITKPDTRRRQKCCAITPCQSSHVAVRPPMMRSCVDQRSLHPVAGLPGPNWQILIHEDCVKTGCDQCWLPWLHTAVWFEEF